jgi:tRNA nucleotidyltransferase/poly(A) polymerase
MTTRQPTQNEATPTLNFETRCQDFLTSIEPFVNKTQRITDTELAKLLNTGISLLNEYSKPSEADNDISEICNEIIQGCFYMILDMTVAYSDQAYEQLENEETEKHAIDYCQLVYLYVICLQHIRFELTNDSQKMLILRQSIYHPLLSCLMLSIVRYCIMEKTAQIQQALRTYYRALQFFRQDIQKLEQEIQKIEVSEQTPEQKKSDELKREKLQSTLAFSTQALRKIEESYEYNKQIILNTYSKQKRELSSSESEKENLSSQVIESLKHLVLGSQNVKPEDSLPSLEEVLERIEELRNKLPTAADCTLSEEKERNLEISHDFNTSDEENRKGNFTFKEVLKEFNEIKQSFPEDDSILFNLIDKGISLLLQLQHSENHDEDVKDTKRMVHNYYLAMIKVNLSDAEVNFNKGDIKEFITLCDWNYHYIHSFFERLTEIFSKETDDTSPLVNITNNSLNVISNCIQKLSEILAKNPHDKETQELITKILDCHTKLLHIVTEKTKSLMDTLEHPSETSKPKDNSSSFLPEEPKQENRRNKKRKGNRKGKGKGKGKHLHHQLVNEPLQSERDDSSSATQGASKPSITWAQSDNQSSLKKQTASDDRSDRKKRKKKKKTGPSRNSVTDPRKTKESDTSTQPCDDNLPATQQRMVDSKASDSQTCSDAPLYTHDDESLSNIPQAAKALAPSAGFLEYFPRQGEIAQAIETLSDIVKKYHNVHAFLFGGAMRSALQKKGKPTDLDIVLFPVGGEESLTALYELIESVKELADIPVRTAYTATTGQQNLKIKIKGVTVDLSYANKASESLEIAMQEHVDGNDFTLHTAYGNIATKEIADPTGKAIEANESGRLETVKAAAKESFEEDPKRILRAIRLVAQYGFEMSESITNALNESNYDCFEKINQNWIYKEYVKLFFNGHGEKTFEQLNKFNLLEALFPHLQDLPEEKQEFTKKLIRNLLWNIDKAKNNGEKNTYPYAIIYFAVQFFHVRENIETTRRATMLLQQRDFSKRDEILGIINKIADEMESPIVSAKPAENEASPLSPQSSSVEENSSDGNRRYPMSPPPSAFENGLPPQMSVQGYPAHFHQGQRAAASAPGPLPPYPMQNPTASHLSAQRPFSSTHSSPTYVPSDRTYSPSPQHLPSPSPTRQHNAFLLRHGSFSSGTLTHQGSNNQASPRPSTSCFGQGHRFFPSPPPRYHQTNQTFPCHSASCSGQEAGFPTVSAVFSQRQPPQSSLWVGTLTPPPPFYHHGPR